MDELLKLLTADSTVVKGLITQYVDMYKPIVYAVGDEVLKVYKDYANNNEYWDTLALTRKNNYDAYIKVGFTTDQAMSLLLTDIRKTAELLENSSKSIQKSNKKTN